MRPGGLRVLINWGDACTLFWGDQPPKGVPLCDLLKMHFLIKKVIRKMHVHTFICFLDFSGFGGFSEIIVLQYYIYMYMFVNKCKFHIN